MEQKYKNIIVKTDDGIATVIMNRPEKLNAMGEEAADEFIEAMKHISAESSIRAVVLTGAGRAFCAGADRNSSIFNKTNAAEFWVFMQKANDAVMVLRNMPQPMIAAVNGPAAGAGFSFVLACDIAIASEAATFSQVYVTLGLLPDAGGTYFLPRLVGTAKACELMFTGRTVYAKEAQDIGIVSQVVPADELENAARELAMTIAKRSPLALMMMKKTIYQNLDADLGTALEREAKALSILFFTEDHKEALTALAENREPVFKKK